MALQRSKSLIGAWFEAHLPKEQAPTTTIRRTRASTYWPYGTGVTCVVGSHNIHDIMVVDNARSRGCIPHKPEHQKLFPPMPSGTAPSGTLQRAGSASALMGGHHELVCRAKRELAEERQRERLAAEAAQFGPPY
ncbi:unnamed protein product [Symbiodinium natans]|uniref:Uncharacterized protein n=1 Tax=Symbiodinium natans TaxID=878477 RepID=A0A812LDN7_9DINO|nr:unnamed protein product [Symbiodinium natans]